MQYSQLFRLIDDAGVSPEAAAARLGVSGMTLRRWRSKPGREELPAMYARAFEPAFYQMVNDGTLAPDLPSVRGLMQGSIPAAVQSAVKNVGFSATMLEGESKSDDRLMGGLAELGADPERRKTVDKNRANIASFALRGPNWCRLIDGLLPLLRSKELTLPDRMVAYGALVYLLCPLDLISDFIPVFGLLDDFAVLQIAMLHYAARFPHLAEKT